MPIANVRTLANNRRLGSVRFNGRWPRPMGLGAGAHINNCVGVLSKKYELRAKCIQRTWQLAYIAVGGVYFTRPATNIRR